MMSSLTIKGENRMFWRLSVSLGTLTEFGDFETAIGYVEQGISTHSNGTGKYITRLTLRRLMSYIYGAPILDVSRSHTTTQHSR